MDLDDQPGQVQVCHSLYMAAKVGLYSAIMHYR